ncbi:MAG: Glutathione hydrolase-like YwrD proenzyme [Bryobacteraceae bacterium]|nr:Glutathione hydrolase-like YwrD proenzyme [Bryobacteraceae bacterium]
MKRVFIFFFVCTVLTMPSKAQERSHARSMVISRQGIAATSQTLASQAGAQILARGGTAMDAAIAANAVLTVVEPMSCGMGGDLFALYYEAKSGKLSGINASGPSAAAMTIARLKELGHYSMPQEGIHSVTVPGCVDGWRKLHQRFGKLPWKEVFRPARYYAREGFPLTEIIQGHWREAAAKLNASEYSRSVFLRDGTAPPVGAIVRNPDLAKALDAVAEQGADAFYKGPVARAILATSSKLGGLLEASDLEGFAAEWVEPLSINYRGWTVYELPPNSQGLAALEMLNIFQELPLAQEPGGSAQVLHYQIEAQKLAYQDLRRYVADPKFFQAPVDGLLSRGYARERAKLIDPDKARCDFEPGQPLPSAGDTIYLAAVDAEGNIASLIQSLYQSFGSGVAVEGYGFHLQNRGALFEFDESHPNALAPKKRPFHTIIPAFMEKDSLRMGFGIMGGLNQAQAHAQFVSNVVDFGMNIQAALEAPRFTKLNFSGCDVMVEGRIPPTVREALAAKGHQVEMLGDFSSWMGGGQVAMRDEAAGVNFAASSPRKDGAAVPQPDPYFSTPQSARRGRR